MTRTPFSRITVAAALAVMSAGLLTAGIALATPHADNLADDGAAITADDASDAARDRGVPHMTDDRHSRGYFEQMDGGDRMDGEDR